MTLHSNGLFRVWTASGCIDHPQMACFAFLARDENARFQCYDSFCQALLIQERITMHDLTLVPAKPGPAVGYVYRRDFVKNTTAVRKRYCLEKGKK